MVTITQASKESVHLASSLSSELPKTTVKQTKTLDCLKCQHKHKQEAAPTLYLFIFTRSFHKHSFDLDFACSYFIVTLLN